MIGSTAGLYLFDLDFKTHEVMPSGPFFNLYAVHFDAPHMDYYGPGAASHKTGRTEFRQENTSFDGTTGFRFSPRFRVGVTGGILAVNVGPPPDAEFASADRTYTPRQTPGIDRQSSFWRGGLVAEYDSRDDNVVPSRGGRYNLNFLAYADRRFGAYSFRTVQVELRQYLPIYGDRHVLALHGSTVIGSADEGQQIPFYLQPSLGGSSTLRGFRWYRFRDDNSMLANAEYRWRIRGPFALALFGEAGKVFSRKQDWDLRRLATDAGFGLRLMLPKELQARLDVGFSREGWNVWLALNNPF